MPEDIRTQTFVPPTPTVINTQAPTAADVYSADNITQAVTTPIKSPDLSDPYGLYDYYMGSPEIKEAQKRAQEVQEQINKAQQALRTTTTALENQNIGAMGGTGASMNLIGTQVGRARDLTANELAALSETQQAALANLSTLQADAQNRYQIAQQERAQIQDLIRATGGEAGITYADSYETALQKAAKYETKKQNEQLALQYPGAGIKATDTPDVIEAKLAKYETRKQVEGLSSQYPKANIKATDSLETANKKISDWMKKEEKKAEEKAEEAKKQAYKQSLKDELRALGKSYKGLSTNELEKKLKKYNKEAIEKAESSGESGEYNEIKLKSSYTDTEQRRMIDEALAGGEDWNGIYETFRALGIDTGPDSTMDKYLKQKFGY